MLSISSKDLPPVDSDNRIQGKSGRDVILNFLRNLRCDFPVGILTVKEFPVFLLLFLGADQTIQRSVHNAKTDLNLTPVFRITQYSLNGLK